MNATAGQTTYEVWIRKLGPGPLVTAFSIPPSSQIPIMPILSFTVYAPGAPVVGYLVTMSAARPTPLDPGWEDTLPT